MSRRLLNLCLAAALGMSSTAAWALSEVNGVYQIGTAEDLKAFAELVNGGDVFADAVLTADIDKGTDLTMIGTDAKRYRGTFDGQGHTITVNAFPEENGCAIFRNAEVQALIQNLKVQGTITTSNQNAAGIVAWNRGTIRNCWVDLEIKTAKVGDGTHGGLTAVSYQGAVYEDCLVDITINGASTNNCGGVNGWADGRTNVVNCLVINDGSFQIDGGSGTISRNDGQLRYVGDEWSLEKYINDPYGTRPTGAARNNYATTAWGNTKTATIVNNDELASGKICYQLNTDQSRISWVQNLGEDAFPVPAVFKQGGKQVYASGTTDCCGKSVEGELTYSNEGTAQASAHTWDKFGVCTTCGAFDFKCLARDDKDGTFLLKSKEDIDLAEGFNRVTNGANFDLKMAADITYIAEPGRFIFNTGNWFDGNFNGDGHALTYEISEVGSSASLFPNFAGNKFENVILHGSISTDGQYAGSISSHTRRDRVHVNNVYSDVTINTTHGGDNTTGGFFGVVETKTWTDNSIYAGDINGNPETTECLAGFAGWASNQSYYTNCAFIGTLNGAIGDSKVLSRNPGNVITSNVYWIDDFGVAHNNSDGNQQIEDPAMIESGELAYLLNGKQSGLDRFYQKIGEDLAPMPIKKEGALVYATASEYRCDGQPIGGTVFANSGNTGALPPHQYEDGFCTECGHLQEDFMTPDADGWFTISDAAQLTWWSHYASKHLGCSARLDADIDMDGYSEKYANIGDQGAAFYGNFDGQYHTISNLVLDRPGISGVGLIACMNSLPAANTLPDGRTISDADARAAEGSYIKNVTLDETCSLVGYGYVALVGMTTSWAGHVNIEGVMMEGDVTAQGGPNAAGVFGCVMGSTCAVTINRCGMTGNVYGPKENGSFSGWLGSYAEVSNCFAVGSVEGIESEERYFARLSSATITNCYAKYGTQVPLVTDEDFESGALAWKANGSQFRDPVWYQTIGEDLYPYADPSHGTVIYAAEQYFSVADDDELAEVVTAVQEYIHTDLDDAIATASLLEKCTNMVDALEEVTTVQELADAFDALEKVEAEVKDNEKVYKAYFDKVNEIKTYLEEHKDIAGPAVDEIMYYIENNDEPSEVYALGTFGYIEENHEATAEEIKAETERIEKAYADAVATCYGKGSDVTALIPNADFSKGTTEGWEGSFATGTSRLANEDPKAAKLVGVEAWNKPGEQYQTVEGMKPGYYLVGINGAYRPHNDRYSLDYGAGIYANGNFNFFPTVIEDIVPLDEAVDQENVYINALNGGAVDLKIYEDMHTTDQTVADENGIACLGYVAHGTGGIAAAANSGRYQVYTIAQVGEDGKLTIGIKNPAPMVGSDWTGWSNLKVVYYADDADEAFDLVLANMAERAKTLTEDYLPGEDQDTYKQAPNFPASVKNALTAAVGKIATAEDKAALVAEFSELFNNVYEGKQAYTYLYATALDLQYGEGANLPKADKDEETGEWFESEEMVFTDDETAALFNAGDQLLEAYITGSMSIEDAKVAKVEGLEEIIAQRDADGNYLIANPKQLLYFRAISSNRDYTVSAKLTADIDMTGIAMQPINQWNFSYRGTFDGQGYAIANVWINFTDADHGRCGLFNTIDGATIKNLKVTGDIYTDGKYAGGLTGYTYNSKIQDCEVATNLHSSIQGDGTHGGIIGLNAGSGTIVENCIVRTNFIGEGTTNCGGVVGWADQTLTVRNNLILPTSTEGTIEVMVSRNPDNCTMSDNYVLSRIAGSQGTIATAEQMASGEIAYILNGKKSDEASIHWYQTIGQDATPVLFNGGIVYIYGGKYYNEKPDPQLNAFAYNVRGFNGGVTYTLNAKAASVSARLADGSDVVIATNVEAGTYTAKVDGDVVAVVVEGKGTLDATKMGESYKIWQVEGLAVNNAPTSAGFGDIYAIESQGSGWGPGTAYTGYISDEKHAALYAFDPEWSPILAADGKQGFTGGVPAGNLCVSSTTIRQMKTVRVSEDGRLFISLAAANSNSPIVEANPANLNEDWKPIFTGGELDEATGITWVGDEEQSRMPISFGVEGKGDDLKITALMAGRTDGGFNYSDYIGYTYNLGSAKEWTGAPSSIVEGITGKYTIAAGPVNVVPDQQGGLWYIQYRANPSEAQPALKHFNAEGVEDYSDVKTAMNAGGMAVSADGNYIAVPTSSTQITVYEPNYVPMANGKIFLNPIVTFGTSESGINAIAFDYAGNIIAASAGSETLSRYAVPGMPKTVVTPVVFRGMTGDVDGNGSVGLGDIEAVLSVMAGDTTYQSTADVDGNGSVGLGDIEAILNIMAGN